jgi:hypothetical protein
MNFIPALRASPLLSSLLFSSLGFSGAAAQNLPSAQPSSVADELTRTIAALDTKVFDAFNRCDLKTFAEYFTFNVEFYHDQGGVTWTRRRMLDNTRRNICGKVRRELIPGSLEVYPINDYGAVQMGTHRFCKAGTDDCAGIAKFMHIWKHIDGAWVVTRVVSYDHRALAQP